jgi:hypothetical protein
MLAGMSKHRLSHAFNWAIAGVLIAAGGLGCEFKGGGEPRMAAVIGEETWSPQPVAVRIYPSTRFVRQGGEAVLEARIELFDDMGDSVKGAGELRFDLYSAEEAGTATAGERLYTWQVGLLNRDAQQAHYDPITRGYLFRLHLDDISVVRRTTLLHVTFSPAAGQRLEAQANIETDW